MVFSYCKCCQHLAGRPDAAANFYQKHFVPREWKLVYFELTGLHAVNLAGYCKDCYENLEEMIPLQEGLSGDALFQAVYDTVQTAHPYDKFSEQVGYYGGCMERSEFYRIRDKRAQSKRSKEFLNLFNDYDREQARLWLEKTFPPQSHTEVLRDTGGSLFSTVVRIAKENGDFDKAGPILDYILPCAHECGNSEKVELTAYEFDFVPIVNYGCEGIYIDCYLRGKFDESGRYSLHVGTLKTLEDNLESAKIMGELCGALIHHERQYVNANLHRYTPDEALEKEYQRQLDQNKEGEPPHA